MSKKPTRLLDKAMLAANPPAPPSVQIKQKPFAADAARPKTGVGRMGVAMIELDAQREQLRERAQHAEKMATTLGDRVEMLESDAQAWIGALPVRKIDPKRIKRSGFANRLEEGFGGPAFAALKSDIAASSGNVQPIKVRHVSGRGRDEKFEIVFGHRRHQACLELGLEVRVIVDSPGPEAHFIEMLRENQARADLSPYEFGLMYRQAKEVFKVQDNKLLSQRLSVSESQISRAIKLVELPDEVIGCFPSRLELQYNWATALNKALKKDRDSVLEQARSIAQMPAEDRLKMSSKDVLNALVGASEPIDLDKVLGVAPGMWRATVRTESGEVQTRTLGDHFELRLPSQVMDSKARDRLVEFLVKLLG